jgi:gluconokinase
LSSVVALQAEAPLVMALDIGTSSLRVALYDCAGRYVEGTRVQLANLVHTTATGGVELDPMRLLQNVEQTIDQVLQRAGDRANQIAAVGIDTFWHSLMGVDANCNPMTPLYTWADTRASAAAADLREKLDETAIHQRTGCMLHPSYPAVKLHWLAKTDRDLYYSVPRWVSFGEYMYLTLFGQATVGMSMASGTGLLDRYTLDWDKEMMSILRLTPDKLSPLGDIAAPSGGLCREYASRWPSLAKIPWLPAIGDGASNNIGSGCADPKHIAMTVGTSGALRVVTLGRKAERLPQGLWAYLVDKNRPIYGGALSEGGGVVAWLWNTLRLGEMNLADSEASMATMAPDSRGLTILPFLVGERSPGYAGDARGAIIGLSLHTDPLDIMRTGLEAISYRFALVYDLLSNIADDAEIIASGGALTRSELWTQMLADVLGKPVTLAQVEEASERGSALLALEVIGVVKSASEVQVDLGRRFEPNMEYNELYRQAIKRQQQLYKLLVTPEGH